MKSYFWHFAAIFVSLPAFSAFVRELRRYYETVRLIPIDRDTCEWSQVRLKS